MTIEYDRETALKLAVEAREDDERMSRAPWAEIKHGLHDGDGLTLASRTGRFCNLGDEERRSLARTRNNLRRISDQLAAAVARIDELERSRA